MLRTVFLAMKKEKRVEWGDQPCHHPRIVQERFLGMATGAYACTVCGRDVTVDDKGKLLAQTGSALTEQRHPLGFPNL